jgi:carbon-monoxide dehydrogenase large subunit
LTLKQIAHRCYTASNTPLELGVGLDGIGGFSGPGNFPNGCVVCELEIDPETGKVTVDRCTSVCDAGVVINPLTITGQMHGSLCQAAGEMLAEHVRYDVESGQLLSGSFLDYAMPRADLLPNIRTEYIEVPTHSNPLGVKGGSESGNAGGPGAVYNAILDALAPLGVAEVPIPATSERIWEAMQKAKSTR